MRRSIESLDDPRQVIDPIRKDAFSLRAIVSGIVDAARDAGDELRSEAGDLSAPARSIDRGGQEFSDVGRAAKLETDRTMSRIDTSLPIKEGRDTDFMMLTLPEGGKANESVQDRAREPDINADKPDFNDIIRRTENWTDRVKNDAHDHPREGDKK